MCSAHIFKLLIMCAARNMCRTHIFKVVYMRCPHFLADACSFPNRPVLRTSHIRSAKFQYYGISNNTILSAKNRLLLNILVFTLNFPISQLRKIPVLWNFQQHDFERKRQTFAKYPCFHAEFSYQSAAQNSSIMEFPITQFFLIKRGKITLLPSVTAKTCCASFPARAERDEFSRLSIIRLNT